LQLILVVPLFAVTFAQISLLGIWVIFSASRLRYRLLGLVVATACLEGAFDIGLEWEFVLMPTAAMGLTLVSLIVVRWFGVRLSRSADGVDSSLPEHRRFRFSIRGLMVLTAVVAVLSAVARNMRGSPGPVSFVLSVLWAICFLAVSLLVMWGALGPGGSLRRCLPVLAIAPALGAFFAYAVAAHHEGWFYIITIMLLHSIVLLGSLLIVRSWGYHLVRRSVSSTRLSGVTSGQPETATRDHQGFPA
jgi:hypothetical protein